MADEIRAEMVANVWKVVAATGDRVDDGDTLVILCLLYTSTSPRDS